MKKLGFIILSVLLVICGLLLIQFTVGLPHHSSDKNVTSSANESSGVEKKNVEHFNTNQMSEPASAEKNLTVRDQLFIDMITNYTNTFENVLGEAKTMFEKVLDDPDVVALNTVPMQNQRNDFTNFTSEVTKLLANNSYSGDLAGETQKLYDSILLTAAFRLILERFVDAAIGVSSREVLLIKTILEENGLNTFEDRTEQKFLVAADDLSISVDHYLKALTAEEKAKENYMTEWHKLYSEETNVHHKVNIYSDFPKLYNAYGA